MQIITETSAIVSRLPCSAIVVIVGVVAVAVPVAVAGRAAIGERCLAGKVTLDLASSQGPWVVVVVARSPVVEVSLVAL